MEDEYKVPSPSVVTENPDFQPDAIAAARAELDTMNEKVSEMMLSAEQLLEFGELLSRTMQRNPKLARDVLNKLQTAIDDMGFDLQLPRVEEPEKAKASSKSKSSDKSRSKPAGRTKMLKRI